ncbi:unnamed protein product [Ectocarpus sp. 8 AP-2014]
MSGFDRLLAIIEVTSCVGSTPPPSGYDGGDCCDCTCVDAVYECGYGGFDCTDPAAACENEDDDFSQPRGGDGSCGVAGFGNVGDGQ